jgi:hypothetical protein
VSKVAAVRLQDSATKLHVELDHFHGMGIAPRGAANQVHFQQVVIEMLGFAFEVVVRPSFARSAGDGMDRVVVVVCEPFCLRRRHGTYPAARQYREALRARIKPREA